MPKKSIRADFKIDKLLTSNSNKTGVLSMEFISLTDDGYNFFGKKANTDTNVVIEKNIASNEIKIDTVNDVEMEFSMDSDIKANVGMEVEQIAVQNQKEPKLNLKITNEIEINAIEAIERNIAASSQAEVEK